MRKLICILTCLVTLLGCSAHKEERRVNNGSTCWYPKYFEFKYVRNTWDEFPEWKYICIGYRKQKYWDRPLFGRIKERKEIHVKNYDYYHNIQEREWNKSNCHDKMDLMTRGRHKVHTYLNNIKDEYNNGFEELTDDKLSNKLDLFDKYDWRY